MSLTELFYLQIFVSLSLLVKGLVLIFGRIRPELKKSVYNFSRKIMGCAFLIVPILTVFYIITQDIDKPTYLSPIFNLSGYFIMCNLITISFGSLLSSSQQGKGKKIRLAIIACCIYPIPMILACIFASLKTTQAVTIISAHILFIYILSMITYILKNYYSTITRASYFYSDNIEISMSWIGKIIYQFIFIGIIACFTSFVGKFPVNGAYVYVIYCYGFMMYVFIKFLVFQRSFKRLISETHKPEEPLVPSVADEDEDIQQKTILPEVYALIDKNIEQWLKDKLFTKPSINIQDVAKQVYTNRTYLSYYINNTYNCSFKSWVTKLRVEYAKELLLSDLDINITEIADKVGFSSIASFTHVFKQTVGSSPAKWRNANRVASKG